MKKIEHVVKVSKRDSHGVRTVITDLLDGKEKEIFIDGVLQFGIHREFSRQPKIGKSKKIRRIKI